MIILDIDNCIADDAWRLPRILPASKLDDRHARFHEYHLLSAWDAVGNREVFLGKPAAVCTARPIAYRALTMEWLRRAGVEVRHLLMRNMDDYRTSKLLKAYQLECLLHHYGMKREEIVGAYDDRIEVVNMYLEAGLPARVVKIHDMALHEPAS